MASKKPLLLLMDGHAMVFRAWFSIPERLSNTAGVDTRGVYGFMNTFIKVINDHKPSHVVLTFDPPGPTFRDELFPAYKAQRPPAPDDLHAQIPMLKDVMGAFGVPVFEIPRYEADDAIGTIAEQATELGIDTLIVTGDADQLQLVTPSVKLLMYTGFGDTRIYDVEAVEEKYGGLGPDSVADLKALMGDPSDNIPGVPGVGQKAAQGVLLGPRHIESLYEDLDAVLETGIRGAKRVKGLLEEHRDEAFRGKTLTTIVTDVPGLEFKLDEAEFWKYNRDDVVAELVKLDFNTVIGRIPRVEDGAVAPVGPAPTSASANEPMQLGFDTEEPPPPKEVDGDYETVTTAAQLAALVKELSGERGFAFDTETTGTNPVICDLVGISVSNAEGKGWYVPVGHTGGDQLPMDDVLDALRPIFEDPGIPKSAHNANYDLMVLEKAGIHCQGVDFDTMVAAALIGERQIGLKPLTLAQFQIEMTPIKNLIGTGKKQILMSDVAIDDAAPYAAADADFTWRLRERFEPQIDQHGARRVFDDIEMPLLPVIVKMQRNGMLIDKNVLSDMSNVLGTEIAEIVKDTGELLGGREVNLNSTRQLAEILFDEWDVPKTRRTKTGYTLDANTMEGLLDKEGLRPEAHELIGNVLKYRSLTKLKSTYVDALPLMVAPDTGRVHTSFNQVGSATGRLSSSDPNVQNIPVRTELGRQVRRAFVADSANGWSLLGADYSQIELRILAHMSQEPGLLAAFHAGEDIHEATARAMYEIDEGEAVSADARRIAKILNFGVIYGLGPVGVARQTDLTRKQGQEFIDMYFAKYPGIRDYLEGVKNDAKRNGYVETLMGRRRKLPELQSPNPGYRAAAERMAVNMPIQGTAADIVKIAMINIDAEMESRKLESRMSIQVHDELIFEVAPGELEEMTGLANEYMPGAMDLAVPLNVETKSGPTWGDMS